MVVLSDKMVRVTAAELARERVRQAVEKFYESVEAEDVCKLCGHRYKSSGHYFSCGRMKR